VILSEFGRPTTAFCACELRSPAPFSEQGFTEFNKHYVTTLSRWKLFDGTINPVARINVCPEIDPPGEPSFHAFSFTVANLGAKHRRALRPVVARARRSVSVLVGSISTKKPNHWPRHLLRLRCKLQRYCSAAKDRQELAPSHLGPRVHAATN
jgi:hypothetical protein